MVGACALTDDELGVVIFCFLEMAGAQTGFGGRQLAVELMDDYIVVFLCVETDGGFFLVLQAC